MKNTSADIENNGNSCNNCSDSLIQPKRGQSLFECHEPDESDDKCAASQTLGLESSSMGHKGRFYHRVLSKYNVTHESRSQSLPNSLDDKTNKTNGNVNVTESCDTHMKLLPESESPPQSPTQELWFNTWPERYEKCKSVDTVDSSSRVSKSPSPSNHCDSENNRSEQSESIKSVTHILSLNEALQSISLAYSPVTKQLHYVAAEVQLPSSGHRRTEAGSFSSTVSSLSLSDPSPNGSLLDAEERSPSPSPSLSPTSHNAAKSKKRPLSAFFTRSVFSWRSVPANPESSASWKIFSKGESEVQGSPKHENIVASSSALIQHIRPPYLPAKDLDEEQRHRDEYKAMLAAAKKREAKNCVAKQKQQKLQLQIEEQLSIAARYWNTQVLPKWDVMHKTKKCRDMWWQGLPSSVRGKIWRLAIGNDLNVSQQLYEICVSRAQSRLSAAVEEPSGSSDVDQESSMDVIKLDIARTFPSLCIFQEGGPYSSLLHSLLAAYVCYRPDVGYVQGMSFIAAILILNLEHEDAFVCFANLLNRPLLLSAYSVNERQLSAYLAAYDELLCYNLPRLYAHFNAAGLTADLYLLDWLYTLFSRAMPLDVACRVWDVFLRDGDDFVFRAALGILHLHQDLLLQMDFLQGAQFLTRLPDDLSADSLFRSIQTVVVNLGKESFSQIVDRCKQSEWPNQQYS